VQLEVEIARKAFTNAAGERQDVLVDFNFTLGTGEIGVFVGPSGCGKSTMLKIVAGLDHDYQGRVVCPAGARIGMVFQEPRLLPWRSVDDNVRLAAPKAEDKKLSELFAALELTAHRNHFPGELSSASPGASRSLVRLRSSRISLFSTNRWRRSTTPSPAACANR
jgi:NitT/TauT family transport system ATP-binding protein